MRIVRCVTAVAFVIAGVVALCMPVIMVEAMAGCGRGGECVFFPEDRQ